MIMSNKTKLLKSDFIDLVKGMSSLTSVQGCVYSNIHVINDFIVGKRESTQNEFRINLDKLYEAYVCIEYSQLNTSILKDYVDRVQSPSLAILKEVYAKS